MEFDLSLREVVVLVFMVIGTFFMFVAGVGMLRMPDLFTRMSMSTKASTLGAGSILMACLVYFIDDAGVVARAIATIIFLFLTAPISAHMIGRAGYQDKKVKLWKGTRFNDLKDFYDRRYAVGTQAMRPINPNLIEPDDIPRQPS